MVSGATLLALAGAAACKGRDGAAARPVSQAAAGKERAPSGAGDPNTAGAPAPHDTTNRAASSTPRPAGEPTRVVFVGTSLTAGLGLDPDDAYPNLLAQKAESAGFQVDVVNAGVSGETSAGTLRRTAWLLRGPVDVLMLETGANDGLRALDVDSTRANIESIVRQVKAARPTAQVLLVQMEAPPNLGSAYTARFRAMFPEIARAEGITLVPFLLQGVAGRPELNQSDGMHPNARGERIVAENVWPSLRTALQAARAGGSAGPRE
jgi:acyl-CoA thioesterase-1